MRSWAGGDGCYCCMVASSYGKCGLFRGFTIPMTRSQHLHLGEMQQEIRSWSYSTGQDSGFQILAASGHGGSLPCFVIFVSWSVMEFFPLGFHNCQIALWDVQMKDSAIQVPPFQTTSMLQYRSIGNRVVEYGFGIAKNNKGCFFLYVVVFFLFSHQLKW